MIFKRRKPTTFLYKLRNFLWPKMGWWRVAKYYKHRTIRISDSSHSVAAGLAIGCAISFTPAFGTHLIQSIFFCWLLRGNWVASWLGTAFGNPWTFPFLWWISYQVGKSVLWIFGFSDFFADIPEPMGMGDLINSPMKLLLPMIMGGYICAAITFPAFYYTFYYLIKGARRARKARLKQKVHQVAREVTGQKE